MLPKVAILIPLGACIALACSVGMHKLAPRFELVARGECLGTDGAKFGDCSQAARLFLWRGSVRASGVSGCLVENGSFEPCSLLEKRSWSTRGGVLCVEDNICVGRSVFGPSAITTSKDAAAWVRIGAGSEGLIPPPEELLSAAVYGATIAVGICIVLLFWLDVSRAHMSGDGDIKGVLKSPEAMATESATMIQASFRGKQVRSMHSTGAATTPATTPLGQVIDGLKAGGTSILKTVSPTKGKASPASAAVPTSTAVQVRPKQTSPLALLCKLVAPKRKYT